MKLIFLISTLISVVTCICPLGYFNTGTSSLEKCDICPIGSYCKLGVKKLCLKGKYGNTTGLSDTRCSGLCPVGRYGNTVGLVNDTCSGICQDGYYCAAGSISATSMRIPSLLLWPAPLRVKNFGSCIQVNIKNLSFVLNTKSKLLNDAVDRYKILISSNVSVSQVCLDFLPTVLSQVLINVASIDETLSSNTNETYSLATVSGRFILNAGTVYGALRGLETLSQLVFRYDNSWYASVAEITDSPRFGFRGIMVDVARVFRPISVLKLMIDAMSWSKFNALVIHFSDNEAWTLEILNYPRLSLCTHFDDKNHPHGSIRQYSQNDMRELVAYAKARGVRVIPEIDSPSHIDSLQRCYPEFLTKAYCPVPGAGSCAAPNFFYATADIASDSWWKFYSDVVTQLKSIFPDGYFSVGGDEAWITPWKYSPTTLAFIKANISSSIRPVDYYEAKVNDITVKAGKTPLMWYPGIAPPSLSVISMVWSGWVGNLAGAGSWKYDVFLLTQMGRNVILAGPFYLGLEPNPNNKSAPWTNPDWRVWYRINPRDFMPREFPADLDNRKSLVMGGLGCIWGDLVQLDILERAWPLMNAIGEQFWSSENVTTSSTVPTERYLKHYERMRKRGFPVK